MPTGFSIDEFKVALAALGGDANRDIIFHEKIDSTSSDLRRRLLTGASPQTIVAANCQTDGRGRKGRDWYSPQAGNLYISVALELQGPTRETLPMIPLAAGIAAVDAIAAMADVVPLIKWPNDLLVNDSKLAGILTETTTLADDHFVAIVGLGVNISLVAFPDALRPHATSLCHHGGDAPAPSALAARWIHAFKRWAVAIEAGARQSVTDAWRARAEPFGRRVRVDDIEGCTVDLTDDGRLILVTPSNEEVVVAGGIVEHLG